MKQGWTYRQLKDVTSKISDGSHNPPKGIAYSEYPMLSSKNILFDDFNYDSPRYLSKEDFDIENKRTDISDGDVLLTIVGTVGRTCCVQSPFIPFTLQRSVAVLKPKKEILISRFLMYALYSLSDLWENEAKGAAQKGVYLKQLAALSIPTPPLAEQERIVERLDAAFAQIDELKSNAERQLAEARALFQSALTQAMQPKPGWQEKTLPDISENLDSIRVPVTKKNRSTGIYPYYGASGIVDYVDDYLFDEDLLCISEDGANLIMRTYPIAFPIKGKVWVNNHAHVLRFNNLTTQKYVEYYFEGLKLDEYVTGAAQPKLTQKALNRIVINLPSSINEQQKIVSYLDSLTNHVKELEEINRKTAAECDALKQALLRQIFE